MDPIFSQQFVAPQPKPRGGGMFGAGGVGRGIAGAIGDYLLQLNRMQPIYAPAMQQRREYQQREQQYERHRQDSLADYEAKQKIDMQYPTAPQPTEYERMLQAAGYQPGTPEYLQHVRSYVGAKENPIVMTPYGPMPYSSVAPPQATRPVGKLTPIEEGGPASQAPGMFPRPY